jgi:hypothetical protein
MLELSANYFCFTFKVNIIVLIFNSSLSQEGPNLPLNGDYDLTFKLRNRFDCTNSIGKSFVEFLSIHMPSEMSLNLNCRSYEDIEGIHDRLLYES